MGEIKSAGDKDGGSRSQPCLKRISQTGEKKKKKKVQKFPKLKQKPWRPAEEEEERVTSDYLLQVSQIYFREVEEKEGLSKTNRRGKNGNLSFLRKVIDSRKKER